MRLTTSISANYLYRKKNISEGLKSMGTLIRIFVERNRTPGGGSLRSKQARRLASARSYPRHSSSEHPHELMRSAVRTKRPTIYKNMTKVDTDNDGLNDYSEDLNKNSYVDSNEADPLDMDSDDDGLMDGHDYEKLADSDLDAVWNCLEKDSDGDGIYDGT